MKIFPIGFLRTSTAVPPPYLPMVWTSRAVPAGYQWNEVIFDGTKFVMGGSIGASGGGAIAMSNDGINWTVQSVTGLAAAASITDIAFGNGMYVATYLSGANSRVFYSSNGVNWTMASTPVQEPWTRATFVNGRFTVFSNPTSGFGGITSTNGTSWSTISISPTTSWQRVAFGNGVMVATKVVSPEHIATSTNGTNWANQFTGIPDNQWYDVTFSSSLGLFVSVAQSGTNRIMTSPNGITWTSILAPAANQWRVVTANGPVLVALAVSGTDRIMVSSDAVTWQLVTAPVAAIWNSIAVGNGLYVALAVGNSMTAPTS